MGLSTEERSFLIEHVFRAKGEYTETVKEKFAERFPATTVPQRNAVRPLINKFRDTGSVHDASRSGRPTILTEQKVNDISEAMRQSPTKSLRRLSQEGSISSVAYPKISISVGTAHNVA